MTGLFGTLGTANSGMNTQQTALETSSHNIANANTPGYSRQRAEMETNQPYNYTGIGQIGTGSKVSSITRASDQFVLANIRKENSVYNQYQQKADVLGQIESIFNETPGQKALSDDLAAYFDAWSQLANNPESNTAKLIVVENGNNLAENINRTAKQLETLHNDTVSVLEKNVLDFNSKLEELNEINQQIFKASADGGVPNDLLDRRDMLLEDLSGFGNIDTTFDEYGRVSVKMGGETILAPGEIRTISVVVGTDENGQPLVSEGGNLTNEKVPLTNGETYPVGQLLISNPKDTPTTFQPIEVESGAAKGLQEGLAEINARTEEFNIFVYNLATSVNTIHSDDGKSIDFFTFDENNSAKSIKVNEDIKKDPSLVNAGKDVGPDGAVGDGSRALALGNLKNARFGYPDAKFEYDPDTMSFKDEPGGSTLLGSYIDIVTKNGIAKQQADNRVNTQEFLLFQLEDRKYSVSGVNINEEITDVMRFQRAFQANARVISVVSDLLDTLINRTGV
ncbi:MULTISPECIES: flagellar hook-associated protein FlgK [Vagococcus]|uniref:Flagellar hook-associated protein 1 n=1 Tax=Vagococcus fluvialis bH819 TaxID=1255619 RepID=A0A1X6WRQ0_9ENTE|nr:MULTISPECIES: flagellar hook-associated protein FlgK [Vagococcus]SLM86912.1 Flagellar hook-associated protein FlgK [Vagococcus fluvialis bH819]HCM88631.1 flagellar hook-associated protein FlgK [Vagococcus sp.]